MILYSTHTSPNYTPPLVISERQIVVGPNHPTSSEGGRIPSLKIPHGRYDMAGLISLLPSDQRPELIVVLADSYEQCVPVNLAAVRGRRIRLVADTHHGQNPLQKMLGYARQEPFDQIVLIHGQQHLHWFTEAAIAPTVYHSERARGRTVVSLTDAQRLRARFLLTRDLAADNASWLAACGFTKVAERPMLFERR